MRYLWVGLGGGAGSMARYAISVRVDQSPFPWATLAIDLPGAFPARLVPHACVGPPVGCRDDAGGGRCARRVHDVLNVRVGGVHKRRKPGDFWIAFTYIAVSVMGGLLAAWGGYTLGRVIRA